MLKQHSRFWHDTISSGEGGGAQRMIVIFKYGKSRNCVGIPCLSPRPRVPVSPPRGTDTRLLLMDTRYIQYYLCVHTLGPL